MSEQIDMVEVKTESNHSDELFSVCKNTKMVANHSRNDKSKSKIYSSVNIYYINKVMFYNLLKYYLGLKLFFYKLYIF